jgi:hypothetical protein
MAEKTEALSIRISASVKKAIEKAAKDDRRSVTQQVEKILSEWLRLNKYLK